MSCGSQSHREAGARWVAAGDPDVNICCNPPPPSGNGQAALCHWGQPAQRGGAEEQGKMTFGGGLLSYDDIL